MLVKIVIISNDGELDLRNAPSDLDVELTIKGSTVTVPIEELNHALRKLTAK